MLTTKPYKMIPSEKGVESKFVLVIKMSKGGDIRAEMLSIPARQVTVAPMAHGSVIGGRFPLAKTPKT